MIGLELVESTSAGSLEALVSPGQLHEMSMSELEGPAGEIRSFLVACIAETGGHLGSTLGIVELTIALHRVLSSHEDAIVWDTGHQTYVHRPRRTRHL